MLATQSCNARVHVVDDNPIVSAGLEKVFCDTEVCWGEVGLNVPDLLARAVIHEGDIVLLDMRLRDGSDSAVNVSTLQELGAIVLVFTMGDDMYATRRACEAGAVGVLTKDESLETIVESVLAVSRGETCPSSGWAAAMESSVRFCQQLTARQLDVLRLYASGMTAQQVASRLGLKKSTVDSYMYEMRKKLRAAGMRHEGSVGVYKSAVKMGLISSYDW